MADLFAGKIAAILQRTTKEKEKIIPRIKGRDYFDLGWFLENKTQLNFTYLKELTKVKNKQELRKLLAKKVEDLDLKLLKEDIAPLFRDKNFIKNFVLNYKKMILARLTK